MIFKKDKWLIRESKVHSHCLYHIICTPLTYSVRTQPDPPRRVASATSLEFLSQPTTRFLYGEISYEPIHEHIKYYSL